MATNDYHFITQWRMPATTDEVLAILGEVTKLPDWWPSVYLEVTEIAPGDVNGVGRQVGLFTKGWLPYTLRWQFRVTEASRTGFTIAAEGDFIGRGIWTFSPDGDHVNITYDWRITAAKPLLRRLSFLLKPLFSMNHEWAMRQGEISLRLELARRRAGSEAAAAAIPAPPPPTPNHPLRWLGYVLTHPLG